MHPDRLPPVAEETIAPKSATWLSALMDGQADALEPACRLWREDEAARAQWHRYQLIGDALRAETLAATPARDADFLQALRTRLALEPVARMVGAESAQPIMVGGWRSIVAVAASILLVLGAMLVARLGPGPMAEGALARAVGQRTAVQPAMAHQPGRSDPRMDEFLRAHQAAGSGMGVAAPGGTLRRVDMLMPMLVQP